MAYEFNLPGAMATLKVPYTRLSLLSLSAANCSNRRRQVILFATFDGILTSICQMLLINLNCVKHLISSSLTSILFLLIRKPQYNRYQLSKRCWQFNAASLPKTWVCEHLDYAVAKCIRKWLDLPTSATLSNIILPQENSG